MNFRKLGIVFSLLLNFYNNFLFAAETEKKTEIALDDLMAQVPLFTDALTLIKKNYVKDVSAQDLIYGALSGMLAKLDPYSEFMSKEKYLELLNETKGEFGGIGLVVSMRNNMLTVISPMEGTPADRAGIRNGDKIVEIDKVAVNDLNFSEAIAKMRGAPGSEVEIKILRAGIDKVLNFKLKRTRIEIENVKNALILKDNIGYVRVVDFGETTLKHFKTALEKLQANGATALILDLRNNPGGLLEVAVGVSSYFLKQNDLIVYTKGREEKEELRFQADGKEVFNYKPLIILVNSGSASGSEIVAGAIRDNRCGIIVGEKTFGKASVQTVIELRDGAAIRLTTAEYYTPCGVSIHTKGIEPDIKVVYENKLQASFDSLSEEERQNYLNNEDKKRELLLADKQIEEAITVIKAVAVWEEIDVK